jgi:hypothetical protein
MGNFLMRRYFRCFLFGFFLIFIAVPTFSSPFSGAGTILHDVRPGKGITRVTWLSEWSSPLEGTPADTRVFIADSGKPGATVFIAGGTHANEIAGILSAVLLIENAVPSAGRLIVIPDMNMSASTWTESTKVPSWVRIETPNGPRFFKYGARYTDPVHQGAPDPDRYVHPKGGDALEGSEARNLNRVYPGKPDGTLTERLAWALMSLLKQEGVDIAFDLHEAGPESRLANMIVANPKNLDLAALAVINLEMDGIRMKLEPSSDAFHGLSHREWGDGTKAYAFLIETPNPAQSTENGNPVEDPQYPLAGRIATHLASIGAILDAWNMDCPPDKRIEFDALPDWRAVAASGAGAFLNW